MDFSKLNQNEKLATYGAILSIVGTILAAVAFGIAGGLWLTVILAIIMLVIVFLPQWSPQTALPGSKGSLMVVVGGIAGIGSILALLSLLGAFAVFALYGGLWFVGLLLGIVGGLMMGWAGWQEFQAEGGKFQLGTASTGASTPPPPAAPPAPPADDEPR
ncbi:MAG TPA: hypothetical protein VFN14_06680 [Candidatus Limnocylindria bacterium]|nr:hypothetical protein [Candidatus Limnocylindria bacterium]